VFCTKCGSNLEEGARFCVKCGMAVDATLVPNTQSQAGYQPIPVKERSKLLFYLIYVLPVLCLVGAVSMGIWEYSVVVNSDYIDVIRTILRQIVLLIILLAIPTLLVIFGERKNNKIIILSAGIVYSIIGLFFMFGFIAEGFFNNSFNNGFNVLNLLLEVLGFASPFILSAVMCFIAFARMKKTIN